MIGGISPEVLLVGLVMPIVVALISGVAAVQWRKQSGANPDSVLGEGHQTVKEHMDLRFQEHARMTERLVSVDGKLDRLIDIAERNREVTRDGIGGLAGSLGRIEGTLSRIEGKLPAKNPRK